MTRRVYRFVYRASSFVFLTSQCCHKLMKWCLSVNRVQDTCRIRVFTLYIITFFFNNTVDGQVMAWSKSILLLACKTGCDFAIFLRGMFTVCLCLLKRVHQCEVLTIFTRWALVCTKNVPFFSLYLMELETLQLCLIWFPPSEDFHSSPN